MSVGREMYSNDDTEPVTVHRNDTSLHCTPPDMIDIVKRFIPGELRLCSTEEDLNCGCEMIINKRDSNGRVIKLTEECKCQDINMQGISYLFSIYFEMKILFQ